MVCQDAVHLNASGSMLSDSTHATVARAAAATACPPVPCAHLGHVVSTLPQAPAESLPTSFGKSSANPACGGEAPVSGTCVPWSPLPLRGCGPRLLLDTLPAPPGPRQVCKHWRSRGFCLFGERCAFRHPPECLESLVHEHAQL